MRSRPITPERSSRQMRELAVFSVGMQSTAGALLHAPYQKFQNSLYTFDLISQCVECCALPHFLDNICNALLVMGRILYFHSV